MGFDVKAAVDQAVATMAVPAATAADIAGTAEKTARDIGSAIVASPTAFLSYTLVTIALMSMLGVVWRMRGRLGRAIEESLFSNWRLGLLGTTGIVLSLASGYTTWDGMRNFTGEPVLSGMVTFGIQGVMLIVAWLIGESFAVGMNQRARPGRVTPPLLHPLLANLIGSVIGITLFVVALLWIVGLAGGEAGPSPTSAVWWTRLGDNLLLVVTALLALVLVALYAASDLVKPYLQSLRIVIKNSVLWVMFLACMATSVFFSFDSLFTSIFPQSERMRAAELRAQNQVSGLVADIDARITSVRLQEQQRLFQSRGFTAYDAELDRLADASRAAASEIERYFNDRIEERNRAVKEQQERITTAQAGQAGLALKKQSIGDELVRLRSERPGLAAEFAEKKADVEGRQREIDAKRVEALAEAGGVEGTGKEGKGPIYRQRMEELAKLQAALKIAEERLADARKRLTAAETRIVDIERQQSAIDGDLAKLKGEQETAEQRIRLSQDGPATDPGARVDPARITPAFETARAAFRQQPTTERLAAVQQLCGQIYTAMATASPATKQAVADIDCDPKQAAEAASVVFALETGSAAFAARCKGGDKLAGLTSTDALFAFARSCLLDSSLPSRETDELRTRVNAIELARDDKAHRFVVTWNAFQDGNRLAYLALAIAIAIDSLVFMSGLFGANAMRSPLSDVPTPRARSAQQLEASINAALGSARHDTAHLVLSELRPITNTDGFSAVVTLDGLDKPTADRIRMVLTAGADILAVEAVSTSPETYRVRSELREYLSAVVDRHLKRDKTAGQKARLEQVVAAALFPHPQEHADIVIGHLDPLKPVDGFTSTVSLTALGGSLGEEYDARVIRRVMNAGATVDMVAPDKTEDGRFYVRPELYETLLMLSARSPRSPEFAASRRRVLDEIAHRRGEIADRRGPVEGGRLDADTPRIETGPPPRTLAAPAGRRPTADPDADRRRQIRETLLAAIGLDADAWAQVSGPTYGAALAAGDEFARARRHNRRLDDALIGRDEEARMRLDTAQDHLGLADEREQAWLKEARDRIDQNWSVLMLLPDGPYERALDDMIEDMEPAAADGRLKPRDLALLEAVKRLRSALAANTRDSTAAWVDLERALASTSPRAGGAPIV
jgi:hypothetical protein